MSKEVDLISVIVTNYNHTKYLDQRMESLLNQTYPNLEIIVIDNCSTDNSLEVLSKYKKHAHVKIVAREKNCGNLDSCNLGVKLSQGEFFIFSEADDFNTPSQIEVLYKAMVSHKEVGMAFCRSFMVDAKGKVFDEDFNHRDRSFKEFCSKDTVIPKSVVQRFLLFSMITPNFSAVLFRKKCFDLAGGFPTEKACTDWRFWFRFSKHYDFYYVTAPLNYFRIHAASTQNLRGIHSLVTDIMELLYTELRNANLNFWQQLQFRINIGVIWGRYRKPAPAVWWKSFPSIWRQSLKYDPLSVIYLVLAFIKRGTERMIGRA